MKYKDLVCIVCGTALVIGAMFSPGEDSITWLCGEVLIVVGLIVLDD
jgi:hypothetical protein